MWGAIALKRKVFDFKELRHLGILFLLALVIFKIAFFRENSIVLLRSVISIFWLFAVPGYFAMLYWKEKIGFLERFFVGIMLSAAIIGIASYYIGIAGLNIKFHAIILPLIIIFAGVMINLKKSD